MLTVNKLPGQNIAQIGAGGHITKADYDQALPELETLLKKYPRLRFFVSLDHISGIAPGALWEDLKFDVKYKDRFGRTAVVGEKKWQEWMTDFSKIFFPSEIKFFDVKEAGQAWKWLKEEEING